MKGINFLQVKKLSSGNADLTCNRGVINVNATSYKLNLINAKSGNNVSKFPPDNLRL